MELNALKTVTLVARLGSFASAARVLDVDPSSVSRLVSGVEGELGFRVFQRSTRHLSLTDAGESYLRRIEPLLEELDAAQDLAAEGAMQPRGRLRLTTSVAFGHVCLVPLLEQFRATLPEVELELILKDENLDLISEQIDLAIRLAPAPGGNLISSRLITTRYRVCASPSYIRAHGRPETPDELSKRDCLGLALPNYRERWLFRNAAGVDSDVFVSGPVMISNPLVLREAALFGLGPALLADWLVRDSLQRGELIDLFPDRQVTATTFDTAAWMLYPSKAHLPAKTRAAVDFLRKHLR